MRKAFFLLLFVPLVSFRGTNSEVTEANKAMFKALQDEDATALDNNLDVDFALVAFDGNTYDKETVLTGIRGGYGTFDVAESETAEIKVIGDMAYARGTCKTKGQIQGNNFDLRSYYTALYIRRGTSFKALHLQFTPIK